MPIVATKYERYESTNGPQTLADTDTELIRFSGRPDQITLSARAFGALVTLSDRVSRETHFVAVQAGETINSDISREIVTARNLLAGSNCILHVTGKWALPREVS